MKRIMILLLALCLLAGCAAAPQGNADPEPESEPTVETETETEAEAESELGTESEPESEPEPEPELFEPYSYTLCFAGDVSLADDSVPAKALSSYGLEGCFSSSLLETMREADVMCLNSEFAFTTRGTAIPDKTYTFRGNPARISVLEDMGTDVAILANNHVFDYGEVGLQDTLDTFRAAGLPYVGAGEDIDEASAVWYARLENCTVAYVAGSRVEWAELTRGASETESGVFRTAESNELICQRIAEARENADFVVVYIHWGTEHTTWLEDYQLASGKEFIDAGADVVVGDHPHVLQGISWYEGKPIFYSMGNFWFSSTAQYTMLLEVEVGRNEAGDQSAQFQLVPAWTEGGKVTAITDTESRQKFFRYMEGISTDISIDSAGVVTQAAE